MRFFFLQCTVLGLLMLPLSACSHAANTAMENTQIPAASSSGDAAPAYQQTWNHLSEKLQKDGLDKNFIRSVFSKLDVPPSPIPMGTKVKELYTNAFIRKPKAKKTKNFETKLGIPGPWFKGIVTAGNAKLCKDFINKHSMVFAKAELKYGVPADVAAALLFVETRLGNYLGKHNAFYMLSSMAVTKTPEAIDEYISKLPGADQRLPWIRGKMEIKANWAYKELVAMLAYCHANHIDPLKMSGSVYGAIGLCQFMPSNISRYGADGNGDGIIDLFHVDDAVYSLSSYLRKKDRKSVV